MRSIRILLAAALALLPCVIQATGTRMHALARGGAGQMTARTPVVLVTIDTLRADRVGSYGYTRGKTPVIDALAADGVLFERAYVQTPITLPSHASILSGTYPMHHKLQDVVGRLREGVPTLGTILREAGYATGAFVGATVLSSRWMLNRGFDVYDDRFEVQGGLRQIDFDRVERNADAVMTPALEWLAKVARRPFFLWVHLYDPHDPYTAPAPYSIELKERPYDAEVAYTDAVVGKLVDALKKHGVYDRALFVLTADHGESLGEHDEIHHGYFIYDASLRVPLVFKLPNQQFKGKRIPNVVRSVDIAPTALQLLDVRAPASLQGESLLAMIGGRRAGVDLPAYAESYYPKVHFNWSPLFGLVSGTMKYIDAPKPELYDLSKDPGETSNIVEGNQALAARLKTELQGLQKRYTAAVATPSTASQLDPETVARLRALGYIALSAGTSGTGTAGLPDPKDKIAVYNRLNRAITFSRRGMAERAIEGFTAVAQSEPNMPIAHFLLGHEYFQKKLFLQAIQEFKETLKHNPDSNVAMFNLARAYYESGQSENAEVGFKHLLEREPEHFGARHQLALVLARRQRFREAAEEEEHALRIRPDFAEGHSNLGSFYLNLERTDEAIASYRKALALEPKMLLARINLALAFLKKGAPDDAIREAQEVLKIDARRPLALFYLGQGYLAKGMKAEARDAFQKAKAINPSLNVPQIQ